MKAPFSYFYSVLYFRYDGILVGGYQEGAHPQAEIRQRFSVLRLRLSH